MYGLEGLKDKTGVKMNELKFMGIGDPEAFRCRVYHSETDERRNFVEALAGDGVIDCPAYDEWVEAFKKLGWLPELPDFEPNPEGKGKIARWRLTEFGREEFKKHL
jgi:hypothetical protein